MTPSGFFLHLPRSSMRRVELSLVEIEVILAALLLVEGLAGLADQDTVNTIVLNIRRELSMARPPDRELSKQRKHYERI